METKTDYGVDKFTEQQCRNWRDLLAVARTRGWRQGFAIGCIATVCACNAIAAIAYVAASLWAGVPQ